MNHTKNNTENTLKENIRTIQSRIDRACLKAGRQPGEVKLLLATKTVPPTRIQEALQYGIRLIGENKVQELREKYPLLKNEDTDIHFIGHLQTNKVKEVLQYVSCIQSVDRIGLAHELDRQLQKQGRSINILIQVNTSYETSKFGVAPENLPALVRAIAHYDTLRVRGLMTIGVFGADQEKLKKCFTLLKTLAGQQAALSLPNADIKELSMGMSHDFETAIAEGATLVRIGTAVFGSRIYPDQFYWNEQKHIK